MFIYNGLILLWGTLRLGADISYTKVQDVVKNSTAGGDAISSDRTTFDASAIIHYTANNIRPNYLIELLW